MVAGSACNQAVVKIEMNFAAWLRSGSAIAGVKNDTVGCVPFTVSFRDTLWRAADISGIQDGHRWFPRQDRIQRITFTVPGRYRPMLIAKDPNAHNLRDTSYVISSCHPAILRPGFLPSGQGYTLPALVLLFFNESTADAGSFAPGHSFGIMATGRPSTPYHLIHQGGIIFRHRATMSSHWLCWMRFCNRRYDKRIRSGKPAVDARFNCRPTGLRTIYRRVLITTHLPLRFYLGIFSDGNGSTEVSPTYTYNIPGTYNVRLIAIDTSTCNSGYIWFVTITVSRLFRHRSIGYPILLNQYAHSIHQPVPTRGHKLSMEFWRRWSSTDIQSLLSRCFGSLKLSWSRIMLPVAQLRLSLHRQYHPWEPLPILFNTFTQGRLNQ